MGIPESQLQTWSHQGSITQSSNTYNSIKNVLEASTTPYGDRNFECVLQGSYGNDTNIFAESDVDIVIKLDDCFHSDLESLNEDEKSNYKRAYSDATYCHSDFKCDVLKVLTDQYGGDVKDGKKAISIAARGNRRKADVIVATAFRRYHSFKSSSLENHTDGICFFTSAGIRVDNYPKQHHENLTTKHQNANEWLKPMIRVLKNMRSHLVANGVLEAGDAPSYYIEGLLYNVPEDKFGSSYGDCFVNAINWIQTEADKTKLVCANELYYLLRDDSFTCWPAANGEDFINAVINLWNNW